MSYLVEQYNITEKSVWIIESRLECRCYLLLAAYQSANEFGQKLLFYEFPSNTQKLLAKFSELVQLVYWAKAVQMTQ